MNAYYNNNEKRTAGNNTKKFNQTNVISDKDMIDAVVISI